MRNISKDKAIDTITSIDLFALSNKEVSDILSILNTTRLSPYFGEKVVVRDIGTSDLITAIVDFIEDMPCGMEPIQAKLGTTSEELEELLENL